MRPDSPDEQLADEVPVGAALALHHAIGSPGAVPGAGDPLPPLRHWLAFLPRVPQEHLRDDGHATTGLFPPEAAGKRRMFVGARLRFEGSIAVDEPLVRRGRIASVTTKSGSAGELTFATLHFEVEGSTGRIEEEQDHVYLVDQPAPRPVAGGEPTPDGWTWRHDLAVDARLLFRFSALTYNSHRIHYDRDYARRVEGYPALVVHGPLQAMALVDLARRHEPGRTIGELTFRTVRPAFDDGPLLLRGRPEEGGAELAAFTHDGRQSSRVALRWA